MNLILLLPEDFLETKNKVRIKGRRYQHILDIHKASVGQNLIVGLVNGLVGKGEVTDITKTHVELNVVLDTPPPLALPVTLILALPRPIMLKRIFSMLSSMGVKRLYLIHSQRVEKSFWKSHMLRESFINEQLILGLEQAKDTVIPEIKIKKKFKPFVEDELPALIQGTLPLLAHPEASKECPVKVNQSVTLAVGPEGGFIPYEVEQFQKLGFEAISLGQRILRVETAITALLSKLF